MPKIHTGWIRLGILLTFSWIALVGVYIAYMTNFSTSQFSNFDRLGHAAAHQGEPVWDYFWGYPLNRSGLTVGGFITFAGALPVILGWAIGYGVAWVISGFKSAD